MKCVCCGKLADGGTYQKKPVCFDCYMNGNLLLFIDTNENWIEKD